MNGRHRTAAVFRGRVSSCADKWPAAQHGMRPSAAGHQNRQPRLIPGVGPPRENRHPEDGTDAAEALAARPRRTGEINWPDIRRDLLA